MHPTGRDNGVLVAFVVHHPSAGCSEPASGEPAVVRAGRSRADGAGILWGDSGMGAAHC